MTLQDKAKDLYESIKSSLEQLVDDLSAQATKFKESWQEMTEENKMMFREKWNLLVEKYQEYLAAMKDKANESKDDLAERVKVLQNRIKDMHF